MCGGYTRVCVRCGLCGKVEPRPLNASGSCPVCGQLNGEDAERCSACGARIPRPPGAQQGAHRSKHCAVAARSESEGSSKGEHP